MKSLMERLSSEQLLNELADVDDLLIVQDSCCSKSNR